VPLALRVCGFCGPAGCVLAVSGHVDAWVGEAGQETSASSLGCFLGIRIRGAFEGLEKWMCVELGKLVEEIKGRCCQLQ